MWGRAVLYPDLTVNGRIQVHLFDRLSHFLLPDRELLKSRWTISYRFCFCKCPDASMKPWTCRLQKPCWTLSAQSATRPSLGVNTCNAIAELTPRRDHSSVLGVMNHLQGCKKAAHHLYEPITSP